MNAPIAALNGVIDHEMHIPKDFAPTARLNSCEFPISVVTIAPGARIQVYSADEARRYVAAFATAACLLEEAAERRAKLTAALAAVCEECDTKGGHTMVCSHAPRHDNLPAEVTA